MILALNPRSQRYGFQNPGRTPPLKIGHFGIDFF